MSVRSKRRRNKKQIGRYSKSKQNKRDYWRSKQEKKKKEKKQKQEARETKIDKEVEKTKQKHLDTPRSRPLDLGLLMGGSVEALERLGRRTPGGVLFVKCDSQQPGVQGDVRSLEG